MRILMINDHIHFGGGGDAVFKLERQAYESAGFEVHTFSHALDTDDRAGERDVLCADRPGHMRLKIGKFLGAPHVSRALKDTLDRVQPGLVRTHLVSKYPASVYAPLVGQRVIQTLHGPNLFCATSWGNLRHDSAACELGIGIKCWRRGCTGLSGALIYSHLDRRTRPRVKRAVGLYHCPSQHIQHKAQHLGYGPTVHIPLGIDPDFINTDPALHDGTPTVLYVGALVEAKGLLFLPDALKRIKEVMPDVRLVLCGRGALADRLKREFADRDLTDNVDFKGFVDHDQVVEQFRRAHVFVLPSIWSEQFGLVGPEAMACGVPCVASNVGGIPEWLAHGKHGFLVPPRDSDALAQSLLELLGDRDLRLRMGAAGRRYAHRVHSPDLYKRRWVDIAQGAAGGGTMHAHPRVN